MWAARRLSVAAAILVVGAGAAQAGRRIDTQCQKNLGDERILVSDGNALPDGARFKVVGYRADRSEDGWSYGPCTIELRR